MKNTGEIKRIITLLKGTFSGRHAWHGPSVMQALNAVPAALGKSRLSKDTHSIAELVVHMTAWRNFVIQKLEGAEFEMTEELNFPKPGDWKKGLLRLQRSQTNLLKAIKTFPEENLFNKVPGRRYDFYTLLHGIIQHDIYHTGQISLIRKTRA